MLLAAGTISEVAGVICVFGSLAIMLYVILLSCVGLYEKWYRRKKKCDRSKR